MATDSPSTTMSSVSETVMPLSVVGLGGRRSRRGGCWRSRRRGRRRVGAGRPGGRKQRYHKRGDQAESIAGRAHGVHLRHPEGEAWRLAQRWQLQPSRHRVIPGLRAVGAAPAVPGHGHHHGPRRPAGNVARAGPTAGAPYGSTARSAPTVPRDHDRAVGEHRLGALGPRRSRSSRVRRSRSQRPRLFFRVPPPFRRQ